WPDESDGEAGMSIIATPEDEPEEDFSDDLDKGSDTDNANDKSNQKPVRGKRSIKKMSEKAKELGFKGDYFERLLSSKVDLNAEFDEEIFAQADDFESLVDHEIGEEDIRLGKRKSLKGSGPVELGIKHRKKRNRK
ncbi:MAG: hypothetical protein SGCHY_005549, partial [Lobulomycetales sp.]